MRYSKPVLRKTNSNRIQYPVCGWRISPWPPVDAAEVLNNILRSSVIYVQKLQTALKFIINNTVFIVGQICGQWR
jgi:hypothetical protein